MTKNKDHTKILSDMLVYKRIRLGMTQIELAKKIGVGRMTISFWENGRTIPSYNILMSISKVLDIDFDTIFNIIKDIKKERVNN